MSAPRDSNKAASATSSCATRFHKRAVSVVSSLGPQGGATGPGAAGSEPYILTKISGIGIRGDEDDASQDLSGCETAAAPSKRPLAPCSHRAPVSRPADGIFKCQLCPFRQTTSTLQQYRNVNTNHYLRHHGGATLPGPLRRPKVAKVPGGCKNRFWKCPLCPLGVSKEVRASITRHVFSQMREDHRQQRHPEIPKAEWTRRISMRQKGPKDALAHAVGCRQRVLLKTALKEVAQPRFPGMQTFLWPLPKHFPVKKPKNGANPAKTAPKIKRISLQHAWLCEKCGAATKDLPVARRHSKGLCPPVARARQVTAHRLKLFDGLRKWVIDQGDTGEQQLYLNAIDGAIQAVQKRALPPASSHAC